MRMCRRDWRKFGELIRMLEHESASYEDALTLLENAMSARSKREQRHFLVGLVGEISEKRLQHAGKQESANEQLQREVESLARKRDSLRQQSSKLERECASLERELTGYERASQMLGEL